MTGRNGWSVVRIVDIGINFNMNMLGVKGPIAAAAARSQYYGSCHAIIFCNVNSIHVKISYNNIPCIAAVYRNTTIVPDADEFSLLYIFTYFFNRTCSKAFKLSSKRTRPRRPKYFFSLMPLFKFHERSPAK